MIKETSEKFGSQYELITVFNGNESTVVYNMVDYQKGKKIGLRGENNMIVAID
jgi:hypothetical protein